MNKALNRRKPCSRKPTVKLDYQRLHVVVGGGLSTRVMRRHGTGCSSWRQWSAPGCRIVAAISWRDARLGGSTLPPVARAMVWTCDPQRLVLRLRAMLKRGGVGCCVGKVAIRGRVGESEVE